ncbi:MAG: phenol hydroxylase [Hyphomonas sp. BRH_c22]|uniref:phenol hydroxylase subunit P4 n=1 Tax=Hyphomonas sp. BRH_c22 TaxID=1629710 RepID=UPI0005F10262|nr:phenol hydroxylase subunit P4 [Hyphomonas sp. BRH_c22]KJS34781.1 MAG: phenol hydroxylase [Hyphomonas sp. BRH_c22]
MSQATQILTDLQPKDAVENFHGNIIVYLDWDYHRFLCSALAFPLPPAMPFEALLKEVIPNMYSAHPDFSKIDWANVKWTLDGVEDFVPDPAKNLKDNGFGHKSLLQFATPGLDGVGGTFN